MKEKIKILFFGSGEFPLETFQKLCSLDDIEVVGLVTSKDKPMFKNHKVKSLFEVADENNIPTLVIGSTFTDEDIEWIQNHKAQFNVVISFKKLPQEVVDSASYSFNVHASLLPYFRGAAPINHAIRLGCKQTGLSAFILSDKIDCGQIITNRVVGIEDDDNFETLFNKLADECVDFTEDVIHRLFEDRFSLTAQVNYADNISGDARKWFKAPKIDNRYTMGWMYDLTPNEIRNLYRSIYPNDGLYMRMVFDDKDKIPKEFEFKIWDFEIRYVEPNLISYDEYNKENVNDNDENLEYKTDGKTYLAITILQSNNDYLYIKEIQMSGKKRMDIESFLRGFARYFDEYHYVSVSVYDNKND